MSASPFQNPAIGHDAIAGTVDPVWSRLRGEAEAETDGREGLKSLEVLVAAYRSARDGKRIALPLEY